MQTSNKRIVALYTTNDRDAKYRKQLALLNADQPGLQDRDIIIQTHFYSEKTAALFRQKNVRDGFLITLTGKDGGEKYRSGEPTSLVKLFGTIDAMPMRQAEMKTKN